MTYPTFFSQRDVNQEMKLNEDRIKGLTQDLKSGFKLVPIPADAVVKIFGNGKLATLVKPNGDSAFTLVNSQKGEEMSLDFSFYIPQGKSELEIL